MQFLEQNFCPSATNPDTAANRPHRRLDTEMTNIIPEGSERFVEFRRCLAEAMAMADEELRAASLRHLAEDFWPLRDEERRLVLGLSLGLILMASAQSLVEYVTAALPPLAGRLPSPVAEYDPLSNLAATVDEIPPR